MSPKSNRYPYFRSLSPVGGNAAPWAILRAFCLEKQLFRTENFKNTHNVQDFLINQLRKCVNSHGICVNDSLSQDICSLDIHLHSSGTSALCSVFCAYVKYMYEKHQRCPVLALGAYTCPEIVSAAIRAGMRVMPVDIDKQTLYPLMNQLDVEPDVVLLSNLYGIPDICDVPDVLVIDDACQSFLSKRGQTYVGCANDTIGITSFGRGKALSGVGGGAVIFSSDGRNEIIEQLKEYVAIDVGKLKQNSLSSLSLFGYATAMWAFELPYLYWIPDLCPFLGLGETHVSLDFKHCDMNAMQCAVAIAQFENIEKYKVDRVSNAKKWHELLSEFSENGVIIEPFIERGYTFDGDVVPLRYPVLCGNGNSPDSHECSNLRNCLYRELKAQGLGVSMSYPRLIQEYAEFSNDGRVCRTLCESATVVANSILTLPVHGFVSDNDFKKARRVFRKYL